MVLQIEKRNLNSTPKIMVENNCASEPIFVVWGVNLIIQTLTVLLPRNSITESSVELYFEPMYLFLCSFMLPPSIVSSNRRAFLIRLLEAEHDFFN